MKLFTIAFLCGFTLVLAIAGVHYEVRKYVNEQLPAGYPKPHQVTMVNGVRCAVYRDTWRAAPMHVLLCQDNTVRFARDWTLLSQLENRQ